MRFFVIKYVAQIRLKHGKHSRIGLSIYYDEMKANYTNALMRVGGYFWDFSTCVRLVPSIWREGDVVTVKHWKLHLSNFTGTRNLHC